MISDPLATRGPKPRWQRAGSGIRLLHRSAVVSGAATTSPKPGMPLSRPAHARIGRAPVVAHQAPQDEDCGILRTTRTAAAVSQRCGR